MPVKEPGRKFAIEEYGCGHYGCVGPTGDEDIVFKITSDITEARFVVMSMQLSQTEGIVKYHKIFVLKGTTHHRRPLFVLWRQAAKDVGLLSLMHWTTRSAESYGYDEFQKRAIKEGVRDIDLFKTWASEARNVINRMLKKAGPEHRKEMLEQFWKAYQDAPVQADPRHYRGLPRIGVAITKCWELSGSLGSTEVVTPIGAALEYYINEGILLADVHLNNIGRDRNNQLVITDPGHAVEFHPRWTKLPEVPVI
jgi:hypothetical protein